MREKREREIHEAGLFHCSISLMESKMKWKDGSLFLSLLIEINIKPLFSSHIDCEKTIYCVCSYSSDSIVRFSKLQRWERRVDDEKEQLKQHHATTI